MLKVLFYDTLESGTYGADACLTKESRIPDDEGVIYIASGSYNYICDSNIGGIVVSELIKETMNEYINVAGPSHDGARTKLNPCV